MKKIMEHFAKIKRGGVLLAALLFLLAPAVPVRADVLIELGDSFWEKHYRELDYAYRTYVVNSPEGYAYLWESPVSSKQMEALLNGTEISSSWRYTDDKGEVWCVVESGDFDRTNGKEKVRGWIKTSECLVDPDYISFFEAYSEKFVDYDPAYDDVFQEADTVTLWTYPCSGVVEAEEVSADWFRENEVPSEVFADCWRDPQGRMWAFVGYCYGIRNTWLCLDDLTGEQLKREAAASGKNNILSQDAEVYPAADKVPDDSETAGSKNPDGTTTAAEQSKNPDGTTTAAEQSKDPDGTSSGENEILPQDPVVYPPADKLPAVRNGVTGVTVAGVLAVVAVTVGMIWWFFIRKKK